MPHDGTSHELLRVVTLLGSAVIAVPIFRKLGLGSVLGYLCAGLVIGPFGFGWFSQPEAILQVAELGVVMFLFVVGLEMRPSHLWSLRKQIFGLGTLQVGIAIAALTLLGTVYGFSPDVSFICGAGFVLTSTAIVMQLLNERGDIALPRGQRIVSVLLFEDLLIVPLLAFVAVLSPNAAPVGESRWLNLGIAAAALFGLVIAGLYLLNPLFRILAAAKAREVMTAAALLVVLGAALLMQMGGLSMALGAFMAGALLAESTFRHQIEADIEPFRGVLLGLFFVAVGMSLDVSVVFENWRFIVLAVPTYMLVKALCIYGVARLTHSQHKDALDRAVLMAQGGEFAFVLYSTAEAAGVIEAKVGDLFTAIVVLSMALTPVCVLAVRRYLTSTRDALSGDVEIADGLGGSVLLIGFGRFGQVTSQLLLAKGVDVTIIDNDVEMIQSAARFGFKIYYGDGTRLDVLHASGAHTARAIAVCTDKRADTDRIALLCKQEFPQAKLLVRSYDRAHALQLVRAGVDFQIRETFESALAFGSSALTELGLDAAEAAEVAAEVRRRDSERFELELSTRDAKAGLSLVFGNASFTGPKPTPFTVPRRESRALNEEAAAARDGLPASDLVAD